LHLPIVICNQPWEMSKALNRIGVYSRYLILDNLDAGWLLPGKPDYNFNVRHRPKDEWDRQIIWDLRRFFVYALLNFSIFHYHSNFPLFEDYSDLKILKKFRKKIVTSYWGCDVRDPKECKKYAFNTCQICTLDCPSEQAKKRMDIFSKYADIKLVSMPELLEYVPDSVYWPAVVDSEFWSPAPGSKNKTADSKSFKIMHNVGNKNIRGDAKGTRAILAAVDRLQRAGFKIEFISLDKVPNRELKFFYEKSDLVIEQLRAGWHGVTALEAMSMQKPVISYIRDDLKKYDLELPVISANPNNIYMELKKLLSNPKELLAIGQRSRHYVVKHRDSTTLAKKLVDIYSRI